MSWAAQVRRVMDAHQRFTKASHPVYLRLRNFASVQQQDWAALGFSIAPTGIPNTGTTDIQIDPPASTMMVSLHNIGLNAGKLRFGARHFWISASFVTAQAKALGYTDETLVFRGDATVGLVLDNQLFSIEDYWHEELGDSTVSWGCTCNSSETG